MLAAVGGVRGWLARLRWVSLPQCAHSLLDDGHYLRLHARGDWMGDWMGDCMGDWTEDCMEESILAEGGGSIRWRQWKVVEASRTFMLT